MSDLSPVKWSRPRRAAVPVLTALVVAGCAAPTTPSVSFYSNRQTVQVDPVQLCDAQLEECTLNEAAVGVLRVPPGEPLQISVPPHVGETPWQVVFRYRVDDEVVEGRSEVFAPDERLAYTLRLPEAEAQLETVEVQQFGAALVEDPESGVGFITSGVWSLSIDDR